MRKNILTTIFRKGRKAVAISSLLTALGFSASNLDAKASEVALKDNLDNAVDFGMSDIGIDQRFDVVGEELPHCPNYSTATWPRTVSIASPWRMDLRANDSVYGGYEVYRIYVTESTNADGVRNYNLQIPATWEGKTITGIASNLNTAIYDTYASTEMEPLHVQRLILPSTLKSIKNNAFTSNAALNIASYAGDDTADFNTTWFDLSACSNLMYIGDNAFGNNSTSTSRLVCKLPDSFDNLTHIGDNAFRNAFSTIYEENKGVKLPAIKEIGANAFMGNTNLRAIRLGGETTSVGASAFEGCAHIEDINFGSKITTIGSRVCYGCSNLLEAVVDCNVVSSYAFYNCKSLAQLMFSDGIRVVPEYCFYGCEVLTDQNLFKNLTTIKTGSFPRVITDISPYCAKISASSIFI